MQRAVGKKRGREESASSPGGNPAPHGASVHAGPSTSARTPPDHLSPSSKLVEGHTRAVMPRQPTQQGRIRSCWVGPVCAISAFYNLKHQSGAPVTTTSVLALRPDDTDEDVLEILEEVAGVWLASSRTFGDEEEFIKGAASGSSEVNWAGTTSVNDCESRGF